MGDGPMAMTLRAICIPLALGAAIACSAPLKLTKDDSAEVLAHHSLTAPNPADAGPFAVKTLFYGSGTDKRRPEFGKGVTITTKTVDVSPFATIPKPQQKHRKAFWGFDLKKAPLNARVWYPDGAGPFPLVLIVHDHGRGERESNLQQPLSRRHPQRFGRFHRRGIGVPHSGVGAARDRKQRIQPHGH